jgi:uncharacterized protein YbaP (TraB family)
MSCFAKPACRWLLATTVALLVSCPAWAQSAYTPPLWEVQSGQNRIYLFGTIHVGRADLYPLPPAVEAAFSDSEILALEVDPDDQQGAVSAVMSAMYNPPDGIENHLPPELLASVTEISAGYGLPFEQIRQMKPYLLMFTLTNIEYGKLGLTPDQGLESYFSQRARTHGKRLVSLESMAEQMQMLEHLSPELQVAMLQITADEISSGQVAPLVSQMIAAWRSGNLEALNKVLSTEERELPDALAAQFHQRFISDRNRTMAQKVESMLQGGKRVFVAVGAMHMVGNDGIPATLAAKGYKVKPLH